MEPVSRDEIIKRLQKIQHGENLKFRLSPTFGADIVILELNPAWPQKGQKKFLLWLGKTEALARRDKPFIQSDKAKKVARWVGERWAQWLPDLVAPDKAA